MRIVFKHQPLSFHQFAKGAAEAAAAAEAQGKFWEMHDKLFANQRALDRASLERYASEIGLDLTRFRHDLDTHAYAGRVEAQSREGFGVGAQGTPTSFINGRKLVGAVPYPQWKTLIDEELAKHGG